MLLERTRAEGAQLRDFELSSFLDGVDFLEPDSPQVVREAHPGEPPLQAQSPAEPALVARRRRRAAELQQPEQGRGSAIVYRRLWSAAEDKLLVELVEEHGTCAWAHVASTTRSPRFPPRGGDGQSQMA